MFIVILHCTLVYCHWRYIIVWSLFE